MFHVLFLHFEFCFFHSIFFAINELSLVLHHVLHPKSSMCEHIAFSKSVFSSNPIIAKPLLFPVLLFFGIYMVLTFMCFIALMIIVAVVSLWIPYSLTVIWFLFA